jgi:hypothetical protein
LPSTVFQTADFWARFADTKGYSRAGQPEPFSSCRENGRFLYSTAQRPLQRSTNMPGIGGFQSFHTARRTIQGFEALDGTAHCVEGLEAADPGHVLQPEVVPEPR